MWSEVSQYLNEHSTIDVNWKCAMAKVFRETASTTFDSNSGCTFLGNIP